MQDDFEEDCANEWDNLKEVLEHYKYDDDTVFKYNGDEETGTQGAD